MKNLAKIVLTASALAMGVGGVVAPAFAQRSAEYSAARSAGQIGEKMDGYLAIVGPETADLRRIVDDINIKRRAVYSERAQAAGATIEQYALASGCQLIAKTAAGEKYQAPDGSWQTRGEDPPVRDSRCAA
jgi:uncharacterized protein YdbL (DUF1318 family)